ncbi:hypothetical protein B0H10DRAFT_2218687 [Mycena sp. CBHHK59/15]|nr:hypothetical protein B0H10DRAFT_2218687 [Mycena sp. CBHHK59/15]
MHPAPTPAPVMFNLTVDDFDSLVTFPDQSQWTTPNPSAAHDPALDFWFDGTYHNTNVSGASFSFDFEGSFTALLPADLDLRSTSGAPGPAFGSYKVAIDGCAEEFSAHAAQNASGHLLYSTKSLAYKEHTVKVTNLGAKRRGEAHNMLVDFLKTTVELAPAGATLTNTTLEETDPRLVYTGNWTVCYLPSGSRRENVYNPLFSGGYSRYTNGDGASVSLSFHGTALFIFGDKPDRHGLYTVALDARPPATLNGVSGCGGAFAHACEKDNTLVFFAANFDGSEHTVTVTNVPGMLGAYSDLDAVVYTTPSRYLLVRRGAVQLGARRASGVLPRAAMPGVHALLLLFFVGMLLARPFRR